MPGIFTISLDFELHWGGFEKWPLRKDHPGRPPEELRDNYFLTTRQVIPELLRLFADYGVHATWAAVGMLMHQNRRQLEATMPELKPTYDNLELSAYYYIQTYGIGDDEQQDPFHYAHTLVKQIANTAHQEVGSHTFAHFYCNEAGQTPEQFRDDLRAARRAAAAYQLSLRSLVFPRNQFNETYLQICAEEGFRAVRSNPPVWFWNIHTRKESWWKRLNRGMDAYLPIYGKTTYPLAGVPVRTGMPVCIPASRLLRPFSSREVWINDFKVARIKHELEGAARQEQVYHLWWHPHNFGYYPEENLRDLKIVLEHFNRMNRRHGMMSLNMGELADKIFELHGHKAA
jgi:peptidoglycan/xylan/chitin deacetylase (PgdA/CDA1 family)